MPKNISRANPLEQLRSEISAIRGELTSLNLKVQFSSLRDLLEDLETKVSGLPTRVLDLRSRGFIFRKQWESQTEELKARWLKQKYPIQKHLNQQAVQLQSAFLPLETKYQQLIQVSSNLVLARSKLPLLKAEIDTLESRVSTSETTIHGMFDSFSNEVAKIVGEIDKADWMLKQISEATFHLFQTEAGVMAVKCKWIQQAKEESDDPEGILYLTDQRLIFERKQEVATKKVLFIATEKKRIQELLFEVPLQAIIDAIPGKTGLFNKDDLLEFKFSSPSVVPSARLHIWQDSEEWITLVNRSCNGDLNQERAIPLDLAAVERIRSAPTKCPSCGGTMTKPILRGQGSIICEFCGAVLRI